MYQLLQHMIQKELNLLNYCIILIFIGKPLAFLSCFIISSKSFPSSVSFGLKKLKINKYFILFKKNILKN